VRGVEDLECDQVTGVVEVEDDTPLLPSRSATGASLRTTVSVSVFGS
jgi:hypothetical protein